MTSSQLVEYLEKYSVAPSPSRDYYGIKVLRDQIILYTWKISHGPHTSPIVRISRFCDFNQDKTMHDDIQRVFGKFETFDKCEIELKDESKSVFCHVQNIARGNKNTLLTLPKHLIKKLTTYLTFKDILKLSTLSEMAKEIFNGDIVWEILYKRHKMGLVYRDERDQGSSYGWKRLFKERQMHRPARNRKLRTQSGDHRSITNLTNRPSSSLKPKNQKHTASTTKLLSQETQTPKSTDLKSNYISSGRLHTANKKKTDAVEIKGFKLSSTRTVKGDDESFGKTECELAPIPFLEAGIQKSKKSEGNSSMLFKYKNVVGTRKKSSTITSIFDNKLAKSKIALKKCDDKTTSDKIIAVSDFSDGGRNSDEKSQSSIKNLAKIVQKSNSLCTKKIKSRIPSIADEPQMLTSDTKKMKDRKTSGKSEIDKTEKTLLEENREVDSLSKNFGLEELMRSSMTEKYLSSENLLPSNFWRNRDKCVSNTHLSIEKKSDKKFLKANISTDVNKPTIYRKFSTPRKPGVENKSGTLLSTTKIREKPTAKKFADIKSYLKCNEENSPGKESKLNDDIALNEKFGSFVKKVSEKTAKKYENPIFLKTESCNSLDSKFSSIQSSRRLEVAKKRGSLKK